MNSHKAILGILGTLILATQSCANNIQSTSPTPDVGNLAGTIVALTFQAATVSASQRSSTITTEPPTTPTTQPTLYINNNVGCRTGPNTNFRVVSNFTTGTTVDIVGKNTAAGAWLVKIPNSTETCWIMALDASPGGSYETLPEITPQPSTQKPPSGLGGVSYPFFCSYSHDVVYEVKVDLSWFNPGQNANGFRVYRFDTQIADLPVTTTSFEDTTDVVIGSQLKYSVEAYNDVGVSPRYTITINSICKK
jgi:hypothetical protein